MIMEQLGLLMSLSEADFLVARLNPIVIRSQLRHAVCSPRSPIFEEADILKH